MTKSYALLNFDRLYVTSYDAIWKMDGKQIQVSVLLLSIFFPWNFTHVQGFQSGPVPGTFTRLRSCIVPAEITEPPKISGGQNHKYDGR